MPNFEQLLAAGHVWFANEAPAELARAIFCSTALRAAVAESTLKFELPQIDQQLKAGGLCAGAVHEFGYDQFPPCSLLSYLAGNFPDRERPILWIGKEIWPTPFVLQQTGKELLRRSVFISPPDKKLLAWSIETALRSKSAALVIAAPGKSGLVLTRRLMLCARQGGSTGLLLVSAAKLKTPSAAVTRWQISPFPLQASEACGFKLQLVKQKGFCSPVSEWVLELSSDEYGRRSVCVRVSAEQKTARGKVAA